MDDGKDFVPLTTSSTPSNTDRTKMIPLPPVPKEHLAYNHKSSQIHHKFKTKIPILVERTPVQVYWLSPLLWPLNLLPICLHLIVIRIKD